MTEKLIECFNDTISFVNSNQEMKKKTTIAKRNSRVYKENFRHLSSAFKYNVRSDLAVVRGTTFELAKKYAKSGRTAVLNFANPEYPGGSVKYGAMAQEECLCRSSNLYPCLTEPKVYDDFYGYHRAKDDGYYSDRIIYTRNVTVFKDEGLRDSVPHLMNVKDWFDVDVITCSAPYLAGMEEIDYAKLRDVLKRRIKNIFESALDNMAENIILGAFGCGVFCNPPGIVAGAFYDVIEENSYYQNFKHIIFAIKPSSDMCPNVMAFENTFTHQMLVHDNRMNYAGKNFSILGDSISTFEGCNPQGYNVYYGRGMADVTGVGTPNDTWWFKVVNFFRGRLLVNNSYSGSRVSRLPKQQSAFPAGCSKERTAGLHTAGVNPDVIIVNMGVNDWLFGVELEYYKKKKDYEDYTDFFVDAYEHMIDSIKRNYPKAEIWCLTIPKNRAEAPNSGFNMPRYNDVPLESYNKIIRECARKKGTFLIDMYTFDNYYETIDFVHPNKAGMDSMAEMIITCILQKC